MNIKRYGCFYELDDSFINIGTFESDEDAYIAAAEHGLNEEHEGYYIAPVVSVQTDAYTIGYEPGVEDCDHGLDPDECVNCNPKYRDAYWANCTDCNPNQPGTTTWHVAGDCLKCLSNMRH